MTVEAITWIRRADIVLYVVGDPVAQNAILALNKNAESLQTLYSSDMKRVDTYNAMIERILSEVRDGKTVCGVFYGHPGVFVYPSHEAVKRMRAEGYPAVMLPGISAGDCLFAYIGIDPATTGCSSYEATGWLFNAWPADPASAMVLWQIGILGNAGYNPLAKYPTPLMPLLILKMSNYYSPHHNVAVYEAAVQIGCEPTINWVPIAALTHVELSAASTLFIPPQTGSPPDLAMYQAATAMGIDPGG